MDKAQDGCKYSLNDVARDYQRGLYTQEEMVHFAQIIGYSVSGWADLSYVSDEDWNAAQVEVAKMKEREGIK
jgi:hypothetical protein